MSKKTKPSNENKKSARKNRLQTSPENSPAADEKKSSDLQKQGSYYYDDSYGYEIYNPDEDDED